MMKFARTLLKKREMNILVPLIIVCIVTTIVAPNFATSTNIFDLMRSISFTLIISIGMTFVITSGNLDLSVGSTLTIGGMAAGFCLTNGVPTVLSILIALALCAFIGFCNGLLAVKIGIPSIIATLGVSYITKGIVYVVSKGTPYYPFPESFNKIGQTKVGGVALTVFISLILFAVFTYIFYNTTAMSKTRKT